MISNLYEISTVDSWTMWRLGELTPGNRKSANNSWLPQNLPTPSCFSISMGNGFQESLGYQNPQMLKTRHRTTHIQPQIRNSTGICWEKNSSSKWTHEFEPMLFEGHLYYYHHPHLQVRNLKHKKAGWLAPVHSAGKWQSWGWRWN